MFLIPIWGVMARDSTPCLNEWVHVEIVKIGLRGKAMQTSLVSLLDVEGCSFRCGCGQQLASVGLTLCRLRWITLQTNWLQEEQPALKAAGRCWKRVIISGRFLITYIYTMAPEHYYIHTVTLVLFFDELCAALSELICPKLFRYVLLRKPCQKAKEKENRPRWSAFVPWVELVDWWLYII